MVEMNPADAFILGAGALGLGIVLLVRGGNWTIDAAVYIARHFGISPLIVGFTIVAFGTSLPELIVSINATLKGSGGIALGNVLGSNIANIWFVIGATALVAPLVAKPREIGRDLAMMIAATLLLAGLLLYDEVSRYAGFGMVAALSAYVFWQYSMAVKGEAHVEEVEVPEFSSMRTAVLFLGLGLGCIALGAEFLVRGAQLCAAIVGVPESVIGLSVIALGTSLPELSTCLIAAYKKHNDIVLGNVVGSNVFNILSILGFTALIQPISGDAVDPQLVNFDIWVVLGVSLIFTVQLLSLRVIGPFTGTVYLAAYIGYIILIYWAYLGESIGQAASLNLPV